MSEVSSSGDVEAVRYSRTQLLIILITPLLVLVASTALYFSGLMLPDETSNKGILLTPVLGYRPGLSRSRDRYRAALDPDSALPYLCGQL